jgi:hypothetical protein
MPDMQSIYEIFATDAEVEKKGKWVDVGPANFLLARAGGSNTRFQKAMAAVLRPHQRRMQLGMMEPDEATKLAVGPFVDHVLLDWKGVRPIKRDEAGQIMRDPETRAILVGDEIPYAKETAKKLLLEVPDLFTTLQEEAQRVSNYSPEDIEAAGKN